MPDDIDLQIEMLQNRIAQLRASVRMKERSVENYREQIKTLECEMEEAQKTARLAAGAIDSLRKLKGN